MSVIKKINSPWAIEKICISEWRILIHTTDYNVYTLVFDECDENLEKYLYECDFLPGNKDNNVYSLYRQEVFVKNSICYIPDIYFLIYGELKYQENINYLLKIWEVYVYFWWVYFESLKMHFQSLISQRMRQSINDVTSSGENKITIIYDLNSSLLDDIEVPRLDDKKDIMISTWATWEKIKWEDFFTNKMTRKDFNWKEGPLKFIPHLLSPVLKWVENHFNLPYSNETIYQNTFFYSPFRSQPFYEIRQDLTSTWIDRDNTTSKLKWWAEWVERYVSWFQFWSDIGTPKQYTDQIKKVTEAISGFSYDLEDLEEITCFPAKRIQKYDDLLKENWEKDFIPGELIFYPYPKSLRKIDYYSNSSGISAFTSYKEAITRGLFELCERDAIMTTWLTRISPPRFNRNTIPEKIRNGVWYCEVKTWTTIHVLDISSNSPFHIYLFFWQNNKTWTIYQGCACNIDKNKALEKWLDELITSTTRLNEESSLNIWDIITPSNHREYHENQEWIKTLAYLSQWKEITYENSTQELIPEDIVDYYTKNTGDTLWVYDLSTEFSVSHWLFIIRILSQKLIPIWFWTRMGVPYKKEKIMKSNLLEESNTENLIHFFD